VGRPDPVDPNRAVVAEFDSTAVRQHLNSTPVELGDTRVAWLWLGMR
jgi:hypothetical protein